MIIRGKSISLKQVICLIAYYGFAQYLPESHTFGCVGGAIRRFLCVRIFKKCGKCINVERRAWFASGVDIELGDYSNLGINCHVPNGTIIGDNVMMGPNCFILDINHRFENTEIPMIQQGSTPKKITRIGNDVWIGRDVFMTPGRTIADHSIIAGRCVLCKDFPKYSIVGGNPSKLIRTRK